MSIRARRAWANNGQAGNIESEHLTLGYACPDPDATLICRLAYLFILIRHGSGSVSDRENRDGTSAINPQRVFKIFISAPCWFSKSKLR